MSSVLDLKQPQQRDDPAAEATQHLAQPNYDHLALVIVDLHYRTQQLRMTAEHCCSVRQRFHVFGKARTSPAERKAGPMRLSIPLSRATSVTSAPTASQMLTITFPKEILVARKALDAYSIISAVRRSVTTSLDIKGRRVPHPLRSTRVGRT
jgi:hypothetical protein